MSEPSPFASAAPSLIALGYGVLPLIPPTVMHHNGRGKCPAEYRGGHYSGMSKWQQYRDSSPSSFHMGLWNKWPDANAGIVCGTRAGSAPDGTALYVAVLDLDATDPDALDTLMRATPASPMVKRGHKGETRFFRAPKDLKTASYDGPDGRLLDVLTGFDTRQTVVPPSIHPETMQPYVWLGVGPVAANELPVLMPEDIEALEEALESCGWVRGGRASNPVARIVPRSGEIDPDDIWSETKSAALSNLSAWVPALDLYGLRPARGGYECVAQWRASSSGQPLHDRKRNLSIQQSGIKDFGTNDTYSAIDLVMVAQGLDQPAATSWLRERLRLDDTGVVIELGKGVVQTDTLSEDDLPEPLRNLKPSAPKPVVSEPVAPKTPDTTGFDVSAQSGELPDALTRVPGLVGSLTDWISDSARKPQRAGALLAALELVGTAAGRQYSGPTLTGTHLYGLFLAPSGAAKDHPLKCIGRVLEQATLGQHFGPSGFMSMSALINRMSRHPLTLTCIDEFGAFLARINGRKASTHEKAITGVLRTAWGSSFDTMAPPEWAGRVGEPIHSPALSIYGVSTHKEFFENLDGADVFNGFLNRFLIFSTHQRVTEREPSVSKMTVPEPILAAMNKIYLPANRLAAATSHNGRSDGPEVVVPWHDEWALKAYRALGETIERMDEDEAVFFTRTAEMAQRLATIRAVGINPEAPRITLEDMDWGVAIAQWSATQTMAMARDYMVETQHQGEAQRVVRCCKRGAWTAYRDIARALNNRVRAKDLRDMLDGLVDSGSLEVREDRPETGGHKIKSYRLA